MHAPRFISASLTLFASSAAVLFVSSASAADNTCALDTDCPTGFSCQVIGASGGCASAPCEVGTICPPIDCPPPTEIKGCMPGPCATDADCATGMVCYTYTETICSATTAPAPSCPANTICPTPVPEPSSGGCTTSQNQQCVPKYALPCTVDIDCGDGFACVHDQECSASAGGGTGVPTPAGEPGGAAGSSGSGSSGTGTGTAGTSGTPPSGTGDVPPPLPPTCTTLPTAHCEAKNTTCQTNADCPSQWTCEQMITGGGMTCAGMASTDPTMPPPPPDCTTTPTVTVSACVPPYYNLGFRSAQDGTANLGSTETGTAGTTGGTPPTSGGPTGTDPNPSGTGGTSNTGTGTSANHAANGTSEEDSGGCQVSLSHTTSSGTALLGLLGFLGLSRRRRSRAA